LDKQRKGGVKILEAAAKYKKEEQSPGGKHRPVVSCF